MMRMKNLALKTFLITLIFFGSVYILLVFSSRYGPVVYSIFGILLAAFSVLAFAMSTSYREKPALANQWGIISGITLWGFLGEYIEHQGWLDLAHWHYSPVLLILTFFTIFPLNRRYLPTRFGFCFGLFLSIWGLHMIMITQFELLGKNHWVTFPTAVLMVIILFFSYIKIRNAKSVSQKMAWVLVLLLSSWTILEYLWGWQVIPGPYSIPKNL